VLPPTLGVTVTKKRFVRGTEIVCVNRGADKAFWENHWSEKRFPSGLGQLSANAREFVGVTARFVAPGAHVLEGGCGNGDIAIALHEAGFRVTALDWAPKTVQRLRDYVPGMEVVVGDVRDLTEFRSELFDSYWSVGVIEHFWDGYSEILSEAHRVLRPGGWLFLTFPAMNSVRRAKAWAGCFMPWETEDEPPGFYQFLLDPDRVVNDVEELGFKIREVRRRSGPNGFAEEFWKGSDMVSIFARKALGVLLVRFVGHGVIIVAQKNDRRE
jgi:SAM-dependent methyltransferase